MVSVIIPVYNVCEYVDVCLKSVVGQTWKEFEIILIDDGSTDGSDKKCRIWSETDSRIRFVCKDNEGLGPSRNLGLQLARYEYVTFLDSDDWWDRHYLEEMLKPVQKMGPDIVCCDIHYWEKNENGKTSDSVSKLRIEAEHMLYVSENRELINTSRTFMWGKIYKKKLFTENRIVVPDYAYEDVAVTPFAVANASCLYRVSKPLYYYRRKRPGSLANCVARFGDMKLSLQELIFRFVHNDIFELYKKQLKKLFYSQVRFIVKKAQMVCEKEEICKIKEIYFELLVHYFPEMRKVWNGTFLVEGKKELKAALRLIVIDERQVRDYREAGEWKDELREKICIVLDVPDIGKASLLHSSDENCECRNVRIDCPFSIEEADEGRLWNLADKIFYEL